MGNSVTFKDSINDEDFFNKNDISITYNKNMLDEFSYSLYATPTDKYDFVTVVLRDIAKGLGFMVGFTADTSKKTFNKTNRSLTFYEELIHNSIGTDDVNTEYINSTQGTLPIAVSGYGTLNLFAPNVWQNGVSLNYYVPDSTKNISELLTYDFGKGYVIRDIEDDYSTIFKSLQGWDTYSSTVGFIPRETSSIGTTENIFPYKGSIIVSNEDVSSTGVNDEHIVLSSANYDSSEYDDGNFSLKTYLFPYDYKYPDEKGTGSWLVSLLKKDGTWDLVYSKYTGTFDIPLNIKMSEMEINSDYDQYQRTCDGYLRCRITHYKQEYDNLYHKTKYRIKNHYYVLDYLPQKVKMRYDGTKTNSSSFFTNDDEYTQTVKIGINGLEGVERVVVEQLDEGNDLPIKMEISDFKKGYFTAIVDKELYTQFTVYSYNKNGSTKSETLTIEPSITTEELYNVNIDDNTIKIVSESTRNQEENTNYVIFSNLVNAVPIKKGNIVSQKTCIDISNMGKGSYILYLQSGENRKSIKFSKKH